MLYDKRFIHSPTARLPQCHAATLVELANGTLLSAWYAGTNEKAKDVAIYGAALASGSDEWSGKRVFADTEGLSEGNPILFLCPAGRLWLFYVTMLGDRWDTCQMKYIHSLDRGRTWGTPVCIRSEWGWMTGLKPIVSARGAILLPLYEERGASFVMRSEDGGREWVQSNILTTQAGVIQPTIAPLSDGRLLMYLRTYEKEGGTVWQAFSADDGRTWSSPSPAPLPNPNARLDLIALASGRLAVVFNDTTVGRTPLTIALSEDDGLSWPIRFDLENTSGEYSYPAVMQSRDGKIHIAYTYRRTHIAHVECDEEWIETHSRQREKWYVPEPTV